MMRAYLLILLLASLPALLRADAPTPVVFNRAQFFPASGHEQDMVGGKFLGSNISRTEGFELLGVIKITPATAQWTELTSPNTKVYRWVRYEAPPGSHGRVAKLKFFSGEHLLAGDTFESPEDKFLPVLTGLTPPQARALQRLAWDVVKNYPGCGYYEEGTAACAAPEISAGPTPMGETAPITLSSPTSGAWFRYTLDGTVPTRDRGYVYCGVVTVRLGVTLKAIAYKSGMAESAVTAKSF